MKGDLGQLQGTWNVVALEMDGRTMPEAMFGNAQVVLKDDQFESLGMGGTYRGTVKLDSAKQPKQFDLKFSAGHAAGTLNLGIYELNGDTWKLCLDITGNTRPRDFATKPGSGFALETFKRVSAKEKSTKNSAPVNVATPTKSRGAGVATEFEGEWRMVSGVMDGEPLDKSMAQWVKRVNQGNVSTVLAGPNTMLKVEFTHDPSKSPKTIDYLNLAGMHKGKSQQGIYEFDGEFLKICVASPGGTRPSEFDSKPGDGRTFTVWKR